MDCFKNLPSLLRRLFPPPRTTSDQDKTYTIPHQSFEQPLLSGNACSGPCNMPMQSSTSVHEPEPDLTLSFLRLPPELIHCIADFLPLSSAALLACCNQYLKCLLAPRFWTVLKHADHTQRKHSWPPWTETCQTSCTALFAPSFIAPTIVPSPITWLITPEGLVFMQTWRPALSVTSILIFRVNISRWH